MTFRRRVLFSGAVFGLTLCMATNNCSAVELKPDKLKHFFASMALGAAGAGWARERGVRTCRAAGIGIGFSLIFGVGKEFYDLRYKRTDFEWGDLFWDAIGASAGSMWISGCR